MRPPAGEAYAAVESPRGEMGAYIISDGSNTAYRMKWRSPSFANSLGVASHLSRLEDRRPGDDPRQHRPDLWRRRPVRHAERELGISEREAGLSIGRPPGHAWVARPTPGR